MNKQQILSGIMLLFAVSGTGHAAAGILQYDAEVSYLVNDNVNNAARDQDARDDAILEASLGARFTHAIADAQLLSYSLKAGLGNYSDFDGLNEKTLRAGIKYSVQFNRSFTSPVYSLELFGMEKQSDSDIRESSINGSTLQVSKWITDKTSIIAGLSVSKEDADSDVFDLDRTSAFVNLDLLFTNKWTGFITYSVVDGDIVSTGQTGQPPGIRAAAEAQAHDSAFDGSITNPYAYRLMAETQIFLLGANWKIKEGQSVDMSARFVDSSADYGGIAYTSQILRLSYLISFR